MHQFTFLLGLTVFSLSFVLILSFSSNHNNLLLLVSFDGFRFDYFNRNLSHKFVSLRNESSYPPYMLSVFPTKTFPNHFSIATGLYTEVHGVLDNNIYDVLTNKSLGYGYELFHYNEKVVPLWALNERGGDGRKSGCMMYPGCNFKYQDTMPSHYMSYNESVRWKDRVDTLLSWFQDPLTPINLGMAYFEQPDLICHKYGPDSAEINKAISHVDEIVSYLLEKAEESNLIAKLNIVFFSDHGGQAVKDPDNMINLDDFIDRTWFIRDGAPPNLQIYPVKGKEESVLKALREARNKGANFSVHTKDEMLERWHFKDCARTPPILITADVGFLFTTDKNHINNSSMIGTHGYDPLETSMRGFFLAKGPLFKKNHTIKPFENINIYPLAAHMLGLTLPSLKPNGTLDVLKDILIEEISTEENNRILYYICFLIGGLCFMLILVLRHCKKKAIKPPLASYSILNQGIEEERLFQIGEILSSDCEEDSPT